MKVFKLRRIIWAIDPFDQESNSRQALAAIFQQFLGLKDIEIQPVYVSRAELLFAAPEEIAQMALKRIVESTHLPRMLEPKVLKAKTASAKDTVDVLIEYAKKTETDLLMTQTHGRHGIRRVFLGSFAETLLLRSPVPVLITNPNIVPSPKFQRILFPTHFSRHAVRLFKEVVGFAKLMGSRIVLFHVIPTPTSTYIYSGGADIMLSRRYEALLQDHIRRQKDRANKRAKAWSDYASKQGVSMEFVLETSWDSLWEIMLKVAERRKVKLIALETESGPKTAAVFGSITRNLVRYADCPVLVLRSHYSESLSEQRRPKAHAA